MHRKKTIIVGRFSRFIGSTLPLALAAAWLGAAGGCQQPLFPDELPRTQYERFDRLRGVYTPKEAAGQFGDKVPALRERLQPYK